MGKVIEHADPLGEQELIDLLLLYKVIIARQAALDRDRQRARAEVKTSCERPTRATGRGRGGCRHTAGKRGRDLQPL